MTHDNFNHDADGFRITVNVGSKKFYAPLGNVAESYAYTLQGKTFAKFDSAKAKSYIQGLQ